jgi:hypothetical protein
MGVQRERPSEIRPVTKENIVSKVLSIEEIENAKDTDYAEVPVPEWGGEGAVVRVGSLESYDYNEWIEQCGDKTVRQSSYDLIRRSLVDAEGNRIGTAALVEKLRKKDARIISRLTKVVLSLNGLTGPGAEQLKNDSSEAQTDASPSA